MVLKAEGLLIKILTAVVNRSRNVADGMSKGVNFLMKKNKIDVITGYGKLLPDKNICC